MSDAKGDVKPISYQDCSDVLLKMNNLNSLETKTETQMI